MDDDAPLGAMGCRNDSVVAGCHLLKWSLLAPFIAGDLFSTKVPKAEVT